MNVTMNFNDAMVKENKAIASFNASVGANPMGNAITFNMGLSDDAVDSIEETKEAFNKFVDEVIERITRE